MNMLLCLLASDITLPHCHPVLCDPPTAPRPACYEVVWSRYWPCFARVLVCPRGSTQSKQQEKRKPVEQDGIIKQILREKIELLFPWVCAGDPERSGMWLNDLAVLSNMKLYNSNLTATTDCSHYKCREVVIEWGPHALSLKTRSPIINSGFVQASFKLCRL